MPRSTTAKSKISLDKLTDKFSSGQLVIGIVVTLFLMLTSFAMGIMVANIDSALDDENVEQREMLAQGAPGKETGSAGPKPTQEPTETSTSTAPPANTASKPAGGSNGPRAVVVRPLEPEPKADIETEAPVNTAHPAPDKEKPQLPKPSEDSKRAATKPGAESTKAEPVTPSAAKKPGGPATPAPKRRGKFGIQVGALFGADGSKRAKQRQSELKTQSALDVEVIPSLDGSVHRLVVTGYAERGAADAACADLRKRPGFSDAWVIPLGS